jgi:NADH:ubiquinone oxidoreductase subunit 5 (subunit L)/multisubunit Na+/H+ antiporter MnhA subunit
VLPATLLVLLLAGLALAGLPPSGGYLVKTLYGQAAGADAWWWRLVLDLGGLLTAAYLARILAVALRPSSAAVSATTIGRSRLGFAGLLVPGLLALCALLLGLLPPTVFALLDVGRRALTPGGFWASTGPVLAAALAVVLFQLAGESAWQRRVAALGQALTGFEGWLRQWQVAGSLLMLMLLLQALVVLA